jgi:hypothetical protein
MLFLHLIQRQSRHLSPFLGRDNLQPFFFLLLLRQGRLLLRSCNHLLRRVFLHFHGVVLVFVKFRRLEVRVTDGDPSALALRSLCDGLESELILLPVVFGTDIPWFLEFQTALGKAVLLSEATGIGRRASPVFLLLFLSKGSLDMLLFFLLMFGLMTKVLLLALLLLPSH